ncbi:MAG: ATPase with chaperone activity [Limnohabitans sp.]|jgi:hypothetical protein
MDDSHQIDIPPSFMALYVPPGRIKPTLPWPELAARYELCEDLAQMLTDTTASQQFKLGMTQEAALSHCLQGLQDTSEVVSPAEAIWVVTRLAELLQWPALAQP